MLGAAYVEKRGLIMKTASLASVLLLAAAALAAQDSAFRALQQRGKAVMGVDQYTSYHHFDALPDGGRVSLQRDSTDSAGVAAIRTHLEHTARAFARGDFSLPGFVHAGEVPGVRMMAAKRGVIRYEFRPLAGGGEVRITTRDRAAVAAVHEFLAFQRREHRVEATPHEHR